VVTYVEEIFESHFIMCLRVFLICYTHTDRERKREKERKGWSEKRSKQEEGREGAERSEGKKSVSQK
jgi:hypothetical protein